MMERDGRYLSRFASAPKCTAKQETKKSKARGQQTLGTARESGHTELGVVMAAKEAEEEAVGAAVAVAAAAGAEAEAEAEAAAAVGVAAAAAAAEAPAAAVSDAGTGMRVAATTSFRCLACI
jgi:hypothetical protein